MGAARRRRARIHPTHAVGAADYRMGRAMLGRSPLFMGWVLAALRGRHSRAAAPDAMAYNPEQLDDSCKSQRARKVAKRSLSRKMRQNVKLAIRHGIDALDTLSQPRGNRYRGWAG